MDKWESGKMRYGAYSISRIDIPERENREKEGEDNIQGII